MHQKNLQPAWVLRQERLSAPEDDEDESGSEFAAIANARRRTGGMKRKRYRCPNCPFTMDGSPESLEARCVVCKTQMIDEEDKEGERLSAPKRAVTKRQRQKE